LRIETLKIPAPEVTGIFNFSLVKAIDL